MSKNYNFVIKIFKIKFIRLINGTSRTSCRGKLGLMKVGDNTGRDGDKLTFAHGRVLKLIYSVFATICASFLYKKVFDCVICFVKYLNVFCLCVFGILSCPSEIFE